MPKQIKHSLSLSSSGPPETLPAAEQSNSATTSPPIFDNLYVRVTRVRFEHERAYNLEFYSDCRVADLRNEERERVLERGTQRWIVDISGWNPSPSDFQSAISALPQHQHSSITRYVKMEDRKRSLVSRLLQYALVHEVLGIPFADIIIRRTLEGKPYVDYDKMRPEFPNFNFSVSHHGDYVAIASEPICLVGLDIVSHTVPLKESVPRFMDSFSSYFSSMEWYKITTAETSDGMLKELYRYWSLKEAFFKAIGGGLTYKFDALEFHHMDWNNISLKIHSKEARQWKFWHSELQRRYYVSIARGFPQMASENFKKVLGQPNLDEDEYKLGFNLPNPSFIWRTVDQLIPC